MKLLFQTVLLNSLLSSSSLLTSLLLVVFRSLVKFRLYNSRGNCGKVLVELGLNEQVPKVEKEGNCDYFRLSIFKINKV